MVTVKNYSALPIRKGEILRYAGCKSEDDLPGGILEECIEAANREITYKVCYSVLEVNCNADECDFGAFTVRSDSLAKNLAGCVKAVIFAATLGVGIDRLISKYSSVSPAKAMILDAVGAAQTEVLCDRFCEDIKEESALAAKPRFSPGYGDFDLSYQKNFFALLGCEKKIGLTLNASLLMSPSKSVTAVTGLYIGGQTDHNKCDICENKNCSYRGNL